MRKLILLLVVLFLSGCVGGRYVFYQSPDNPEQIPTGVYEDTRVGEVEIRNLETNTPYPTYTNVPSNTPVASSTATRTPTSTSTHTLTPTSTLTPEIRPSVTPGAVCGGTVVTTVNLNVRSIPLGNIVDRLAPGTKVEIIRFRVVQGNEWAELSNGWAVSQLGTETYIEYPIDVHSPEGLACLAVPYEDPTLPTAPPSRTPSVTPELPTSTPAISPTPSNTFVFMSPTPDGGIPSATPRPTTIAPGCVMRAASPVRIRTGPGTNYPQTGTWPDKGTKIISQFVVTETHMWAKIPEGFSAAYIYNVPEEEAWLLESYGAMSEQCQDTPGWDQNLVPPEPIVLNTIVGIRTVPGASGFQDMYPILEAKGIPYGVSPYASLNYCIDTLERGGTCVFRPGFPDCPEPRGVGSAVESALNFMQHAEYAANRLKGYDNVWIEPINECNHTPMSGELMAWWGVWMNTYIDEAADRGWPPLALPGLPPGHGDEHMFYVWKPVLIKLAVNGGLFSMHDYTFNSQTGLCVYDEWEAARHTHNHELMIEQGYEIPITITEAARWAGEAPVDVNDFICWVNKARAEGYIHSVWLWLGGAHPSWLLANLDGYYVPIAEGIKGET